MRASITTALVLLMTMSSTALAQRRTADINGAIISYEVTGQGEPLVLIHGGSVNANMWQPQIAALSRKFQVLNYDRRGFGRSSGGEDITWDADDLKALLDR